jgi:excisionase family DNA binding protein
VTSKPANTHNAARSVAAPPHFLTINDIANCLDVCPRTVRRWIKSGALPVHRIERIVRISPADFAAFLALRRDVFTPVRP